MKVLASTHRTSHVHYPTKLVSRVATVQHSLDAHRCELTGNHVDNEQHRMLFSELKSSVQSKLIFYFQTPTDPSIPTVSMPNNHDRKG